MYIKLFEKWGIDKNLEEATDEYLSKMKKDPEKDSYNFVLYHDNGNYFFEIKIVTFEQDEQKGNLSYDTNNETGQTYNYVISLKYRNDRSTLLHELKHLDRVIRTGRDKGILKTGLRWTDKLKPNTKNTKSNNNIKTLFYLLEDDEFEAKYHSYYVEIDKYLENNLKENPTKEDVIEQINHFLKLPETDKSYSWWRNELYLEFKKNSNKESIEELFDLLINGEITPVIIPSLDIRKMYLSVKTYIKQKFNIKSKLEKEQMSKLIHYVETLMNKNKDKYKKKFNRLYTIMIDKYVN